MHLRYYNTPVQKSLMTSHHSENYIQILSHHTENYTPILPVTYEVLCNLVPCRRLPFTYSAPAIHWLPCQSSKRPGTLYSKASPLQSFCTAKKTLQPWNGVAVKDLLPSPASHALLHICICSPGTFVLQFLYLGPWAEVFIRCLCWGCLMFGDIFTLQAYFSPADSVFPFWALPPHPSFPPLPRAHKTAGAFWSECPQQPEDPHVCADLLDSWLVCCTERESNENVEK